MKISEVFRKTKETKIFLKVDLLKTEVKEIKIDTQVGFLNHMLELFAYHSNIGLFIKADGDIEVDYHHLVEDVGIVLGEALFKALGERKGINRYGEATIPMEEALTQAVIDLAKRPYLHFDVKFPTEKIGTFDSELIEEFFRALVFNARFTLHIRNFYGKNSHHIAESVFKAFAHAFKKAISLVNTEVFSTKGTL